ncbi:hypothetical protein K438DRAFT_1871898 [Mycena galopus ATCC 62051]|nr:hypothetical protein K438DRAFT_1871898 [Mycena galopus ATCC 62051]
MVRPSLSVPRLSLPFSSSFPLSFLAFFLTKRLPRDAAGLSDYELRDLNDEINKQMREKKPGRTRSLRWAGRITAGTSRCWEGGAGDEGV